jgi:hypothetical protein
MILVRNRLYFALILACIAGSIWLYLNIAIFNIADTRNIEICLIKKATNLPCPSCGTTRSVISLLKGDFVGAFYLNPNGYFILAIILLAPIWILADLITKSQSMLDIYFKVENIIKRPKIAYILIFLVIIVWFWNITKSL